MDKFFSIGVLSISTEDIIQSFPEDKHKEIVKNLIDEESLEEIAPLAWSIASRQLDDTFWEIFSDSIMEAAMEVFDIDIDINEGEYSD